MPTPPPPGFSGDGVYQVGQSVQPGIYVSIDNSGCYGQRAKDASGSLDSIIQNDNADGHAVVQINAGEIFTTRDCNRWTVYQTPLVPMTTFGDGTWVVPSQVPPGRWQSTGSGSCYWQRSKDLAGGIDSIAANDNTTGPAIVDIQPGDAAFVSKGCGTWTKVG
jgi:hypothetical protein